MTGETFIALLVFLYPLAYSPRPGNVFFAAIGESKGLRATVPALALARSIGDERCAHGVFPVWRAGTASAEAHWAEDRVMRLLLAWKECQGRIRRAMEILVLGPVEARVNGQSVPI